MKDLGRWDCQLYKQIDMSAGEIDKEIRHDNN